MEIVVFEVEEWEKGAFDQLQDDHEVVLLEGPLNADNASEYADAEIISTFIYSELDAEVLRQFDDLALIATRSTGFDHIDVDYCEEKGIAVCNVPSYGDNTVAEHVFGLLLAISHNLVEAVDRTRRGDFTLQGLRGFDLRGKTLGVIGTGSIGRYVIQIAKGFQMEVLAFDVAEDEDLASQLGFRYVPMDELLSEAHIVTLHVPANEHTHHLLSEDEFEKMREGAILINTARGSVVDVRAMMLALAEGKLAAAGLDVLAEEPTIREEIELIRSVYREKHDLQTLLANHILLRMRDVIITPHSAFYTREAIGRILETTVENIATFLAKEPQNLVA